MKRKAGVGYLRFILGIVLCLVGDISNFDCNNNNSPPCLSAEMRVHQYEERLRFEKTIKFSTAMILRVAKNLMAFCIASCPGVNKDSALYFSENLKTWIRKADKHSIKDEELFYIGYEKMFSNCLYTRYFKEAGYRVIIPEPRLHIFNINSVEAIGNATVNSTIIPITEAPRNADTREERSATQVEQKNDIGEICNATCQKKKENLNYMDGFIEHIVDTFISSTLLKNTNVTLKEFKVALVVNFFKVAVALFYERCLLFYKPYANFWEKFIFGLQHFFEENTENLSKIIYYFSYKGLANQFEDCAKSPLWMDLFRKNVEIGKTYAL